MSDAIATMMGRKRLREWLPTARIEARKVFTMPEAISAVSKATFAHISEGNLDALVIYPAPKGGWHADIVLKEVPPGVANSFGTPVGSPCASFEEAERVARKMLVMALEIDRINRKGQEPPPLPAFELYGCTLALLPKLFEAAKDMMADVLEEEYASYDAAMERVGERVALLAPDGFTAEAFNDWPMEKKAKLLSVLHLAALKGVFRYPPLPDGKPLTHPDDSTTKH